jgi:hypothetical protein
MILSAMRTVLIRWATTNVVVWCSRTCSSCKGVGGMEPRGSPRSRFRIISLRASQAFSPAAHPEGQDEQHHPAATAPTNQVSIELPFASSPENITLIDPRNCYTSPLFARGSRDERRPVSLETRLILRADRGPLPYAKGHTCPGSRAGQVIGASLLCQHLADALDGVFPADAGMNRDAAAPFVPQGICGQGRQGAIEWLGQEGSARAASPTRTGDDQCVIACELSRVKLLGSDQIRL